jgi:hypothetical protein
LVAVVEAQVAQQAALHQAPVQVVPVIKVALEAALVAILIRQTLCTLAQQAAQSLAVLMVAAALAVLR